MTQYEYVESLNEYLDRTYNVTVFVQKKERWRAGYTLTFGYGTGSREVAFHCREEDWKERLFGQVNEFLKSRKLIE